MPAIRALLVVPAPIKPNDITAACSIQIHTFSLKTVTEEITRQSNYKSCNIILPLLLLNLCADKLFEPLA